MLKKEFSEVFKQILYFILVMVLLPVPLLILKLLPDQSYFDIFFSLYHFGLLFLALFMGASIFSFDRDQRGIEYLLSLPYSRLKIVGFKILPRLIVILVFYLVYLIFYPIGGESYSILLFISFTTAYFALFLIALSLSANSENFLVLSLTSLFSLFIYLGLINLVVWVVLLIKGISPDRIMELGLRSFMVRFHPLIALAIVLPFLISFVLSIRKFDVRPAKIYNKRYFKYFTPLLALGLIISILFAYLRTGIGYKTYHLTHDLKLIESGYPSIRVYEKDKAYMVRGEIDVYWPTLEENEYVYHMSGREVKRLNTSNFTSELLYRVPYKKRITWQSWKYNQTIVLLEKDKKLPGIQLVLIDESSKEIKRIPFTHQSLRDYYHPIIFGSDKIDGKRFWLVCSERVRGRPILRVWEDGRVEKIGNSQKRPLYVNQLLITYTDQALVISQEREGKFETIRKIPEGKDWNFRIAYLRPNLNNFPLKEIYGRKERKIARLNLENFEIKEIGEAKGYVHCFFPDDCYVVEIYQAASMVKVYKLEGDKLKLLKSFQNYDTRDIYNRFHLCQGGVVIEEGKKVKVYAFPDLKPLKFKKLK